jgi:hypothetical protein
MPEASTQKQITANGKTGGHRDADSGGAVSSAAPTMSTGSSQFIADVIKDLAALREPSQRDAVVRLAGYSVLDFLQVAKDIKLSPQRVATIFSDPSVQQKHQSFFEGVRDKARALATSDFSNKHTSERHNLTLLYKNPSSNSPSSVEARDFFQPHSDSDCSRVLDKIDSFYRRFVSLRQVKGGHAPTPQHSEWMDDKFQWLMERYERLLDKHQYTSAWREKIQAACGGADAARGALTEKEHVALFGEKTIAFEKLATIARKAGIDLAATEQQRLLKENGCTESAVVYA